MTRKTWFTLLILVAFAGAGALAAKTVLDRGLGAARRARATQPSAALG